MRPKWGSPVRGVRNSGVPSLPPTKGESVMAERGSFNCSMTGVRLTEARGAMTEPETEDDADSRFWECWELRLKGWPSGAGTGGARKNNPLKSPSKLGRMEPSLPDDSEASELRLSYSNAVECAVEWPELRRESARGVCSRFSRTSLGPETERFSSCCFTEAAKRID